MNRVIVVCVVVSLSLLAGCSRTAEKQAPAEPPMGSVERLDPALEAIVPADARIERVATGFEFTEGPLYMREGYLLFSDVTANVIRKWTPGGTTVDFRTQAGYEGTDAPAGSFIGPNGLTSDKEGRLIICEHGNGRLTRLEKDGTLTVLASNYQGKRLNSPNDVVFKSDGSLYFTDPPYGFPKQDEDPKKELKFNGIYRLNPNGTPILLNREMTRPNGLAFSPDEKILYVANSDEARKVWMRYDVKPNGELGPGSVFFDATARTEDGLPDGMKVDVKGNLYCAGPGGVWIFSPDGKHLGTIKTAETPANVHWGKYATSAADAAMAPAEEATTLYITARTSVYRVQLSIPGIRP